MSSHALMFMPYAQAKIEETATGSKLISYRTTVCTIENDWLRCTGLFSRTTRRHISAYVREKAPRLNYYDAKACYERNQEVNIYTREFRDINNRQSAENEEDYTMVITQDVLNRIFDDCFREANGTLSPDFNNVLINQLCIKDDLLQSLSNPNGPADFTLCFKAIRSYLAVHINNWSAGEPVEGFSDFMLVRTIDRYRITPFLTDLIKPTLNFIASCRSGSTNTNEKKEEESTMKPIQNQDTENTEAVEIEEITCSECGCIITDEDYVEINGEIVCQDCLEREFVQCSYCNEWVRKDDAICDADGDWWCQDCADEHLSFCEMCEEYHDIDDMTFIESEDRWVCDDCRARHYTQCDRCGEWVRDGDTYTVIVSTRGYTETWCDDCAMDYSWSCDNCGERYSDDVSSSENDGEWLCPDCAEDSCGCQDTGDIDTWRSPRTRQGYHFKPAPCLCATESEKSVAGADWKQSIVFYGFELEIDRGQKCYKEDE